MNERNCLKFGYFKEFFDPSFIFYGNRDSLGALQDVLQSLPLKKHIILSNDPKFSSVFNERLCLCLTLVPEGLHYLGNELFEWRLSVNQIEQFAKLITELIKSPLPGHHYLEVGAASEIVVIVSKDEYPENWLPK